MYKIDMNNIPKHIAIILDGNGRWAKKYGLPRYLGHRKGALNLRDISVEANKLGIKYLTVYAFSTENWKRPEKEVNYLMTQPLKYYKKYKKKILESNFRINVLGRKDRLSKDFLDMANEVEELTKNNTGLTISLCIDYGSTNEIVTATKNIVKDVLENKLKIDDINETMFKDYLFTKDLPTLDLLIRTSGEVRISNYLLYQMAYSELYFTECFWPEFNKEELKKAIYNFQNRKRRFGGLEKE